MTSIDDARQPTTWDDEEQQQERPPKKRRFFVEDSPDKPIVRESAAQDETSFREEDDARKETKETRFTLCEAGFDVDMIETVVGTKLDDDTLYTLYCLSDKQVESGSSANDKHGITLY